MKKILSLALAAMMMVSVLPVAYAADTVDVAEGTIVEVVGTKASAYEVAVPAKMNPGQTGTVSVSGNWGAAETLTVTAPDTVELFNGDRSMEVGVTFGGITKAGHDVDAVSASADVAIAAVDTSTFFGTWTGLIEYNVEFDGNGAAHPVEMISFTVGDINVQTYQAEAGMTWADWVASDYNTVGAEIKDGSDHIWFGEKELCDLHTYDWMITTDVITDGQQCDVVRQG